MKRNKNVANVNRNKKLKSSTENQDRISNLPDSVLVHILSLLPTNDALKTVVIPRFGNLWASIHTISFDVRRCLYVDGPPLNYDCSFYPYYPKYDKNLYRMRHVLVLHERPEIYKFQLKLEFWLDYGRDNSDFESERNEGCYAQNPDVRDNFFEEKRMVNEIGTWIRFALRKKVKVLDLDFGEQEYPDPYSNYKLPKVVYTCESLTELRLASCNIKLLGQIRLISLKKLMLKGILLSGKIMDKILNGCPLLESLSLINCYEPYDMRKLDITHSNIKHLRIFVGYGKLQDDFISVSCPNLTSFDIAGAIERVDLMNVYSLLGDSYGGFELLNWCIMVSKTQELADMPCPAFSWKCLVLDVKLTKWHLPWISSLLRNSPRLETLTLHIYPGWYKKFKKREAEWIQTHDFDGHNYWNSQEDTYQCLNHQLKMVTIVGYIAEPYVIELIEFLLKNAKVLEKMVIKMVTKKTSGSASKKDKKKEKFSVSMDDFDSRLQKMLIGGPPEVHYTSEQLLDFSNKLSNLQRASAQAVVNLSL